MAQSFLGINPGTVVRDALAPTLLDDAAFAATADGAWVNVGFGLDIAWELVIGAVTGTSVTINIAIEGADDSSGTNTVSYGRFATVTDASDATTLYLQADVWKPWVRYSAIVAGTTPVADLTIKGRQSTDHASNTRTA